MSHVFVRLAPREKAESHQPQFDVFWEDGGREFKVSMWSPKEGKKAFTGRIQVKGPDGKWRFVEATPAPTEEATEAA